MFITGIQAAQNGPQVSAHHVPNSAAAGVEPSRVIFQATPGENVQPHVEHPKSPQRRHEESDNHSSPEDEMSNEATEEIPPGAVYGADVKAIDTPIESLGILVDTKA